MKTKMFATLFGLALMTTSAPAMGLDFCSDSQKCKSGETCHAGVCLPDAMFCKADAGCADFEVCDFSCPHGGAITVSPTSGGAASSGSSSAGSAGEDVPAGEDASSGEKKDGEDKKEGDEQGGPSNTQVGGNCPKDVGVCMVSFSKVKVDAQCEQFCKVMTKCGGLGDGAGSGASGGSDGKETPPVPTQPPKSDSGDKDGSAGSGGGSGSGDTPESDDKGSTDEDGEDDEKEDKGGDNPKSPMPSLPDDKGPKGGGEHDTEACAKLCSATKLLKMGTTELDAAATCVISADKSGQQCDAIGKSCEKKLEAFASKLQDSDAMELKLAGGFGAAAAGSNEDATDLKGSTSSDGNGSGSTEQNQDQGTAAEDDGGAANGAATGGCTAAGTGRSTTSGGLALALALLLLGLQRQRCATLQPRR